nr:hypothetical protein BaRGS_000638 [Batillaria attramentaria]
MYGTCAKEYTNGATNTLGESDGDDDDDDYDDGNYDDDDDNDDEDKDDDDNNCDDDDGEEDDEDDFDDKEHKEDDNGDDQDEDGRRDTADDIINQSALTTLHFMESFNCSINFIIYYTMSTRFRETLKDMVHRKDKGKVQATSIATISHSSVTENKL